MVSINGIKNEYIIDLSESVDSKYVLSTDSNDSINISYVSNSDAIYAYIFEKNNISIEDIAAVCGINRSYFGKIFRNIVGQSPQEFLMNYRMIKATELLKLTSLSIADIGSAVGYENQLHFSRAFKNVYGISPREWRNQHK